MTQQIKIFCDACEKECNPQDGAGVFAGNILRLNVKLEKQAYQFRYDYCPECSVVILNFISELKKDVKSRRSDKQAEHRVKSDPRKK